MGVRQADLARDVGITRQTVIAIEKGRLNPSVVVALKIARVLREPVDYVFYLPPGAFVLHTCDTAQETAPPELRPVVEAPVAPAEEAPVGLPPAELTPEDPEAVPPSGETAPLSATPPAEPVPEETPVAIAPPEGAPPPPDEPEALPPSDDSPALGQAPPAKPVPEREDESEPGQAIWDFV